MARKLALPAMAIVASSVAFSPTVVAQPANQAAPQAFRPCDWVTSQEATAYKYCDTVERFARTAIDRIPA
jgi:hypothetical protein